MEASPLFDDDLLLPADDEIGAAAGIGAGIGAEGVKSILPNVTTEPMPLEVTPLEAVLNRVADN